MIHIIDGKKNNILAHPNHSFHIKCYESQPEKEEEKKKSDKWIQILNLNMDDQKPPCKLLFLENFIYLTSTDQYCDLTAYVPGICQHFFLVLNLRRKTRREISVAACGRRPCPLKTQSICAGIIQCNTAREDNVSFIQKKEK